MNNDGQRWASCDGMALKRRTRGSHFKNFGLLPVTVIHH
jgi:hypothetical protein